jgi:hypothetical protein
VAGRGRAEYRHRFRSELRFLERKPPVAFEGGDDATRSTLKGQVETVNQEGEITAGCLAVDAGRTEMWNQSS